MEYRSKVDWRSALGLLTGAALTVNWLRDLPEEWLFNGSAFFLFFIFGFGYPVRYKTDGDALILYAGMIRRRRIPYTDITRIAPSENVSGTYALSRDKLVIEHNGKKTAVSPKERESFLVDVAMRSPQLSKHGDELRDGVS